MSTTTPNWTDAVNVVASATLARGSSTRGTLDVRSKAGAMLKVRIGRQGTTALTNGVVVRIDRTISNDSKHHPASFVQLNSQIAAASSTTVNVDSNSGQKALNVASVSGFAVGDLILIGGGTAREEWGRVAKTATGVLTLDDNLEFTHTSAQADTVRSKADLFADIWLPGGSTYTVVFDYSDDSAGESVTVEAIACTYDSDTSA